MPPGASAPGGMDGGWGTGGSLPEEPAGLSHLQTQMRTGHLLWMHLPWPAPHFQSHSELLQHSGMSLQMAAGWGAACWSPTVPRMAGCPAVSFAVQRIELAGSACATGSPIPPVAVMAATPTNAINARAAARAIHEFA